MKKIDKSKIQNYSAVLTAKCGENILVWRDSKHLTLDQMKEHIKNCPICQKLIKNV